MALTGKGSKPANITNFSGKTKTRKIKLSSTGGSIAPNNTSFSSGSISNSATPGIPIKAKGAVETNPKIRQIEHTGSASKMAVTNKLPGRMTQKGSRPLPIKTNRYAQPDAQVRGARGASDSTVANLKSYLKRKAQGKVR